MELRDSERQQFMKERARIEGERAAAALKAAQARKDKLGKPVPKSSINSVRIKPAATQNSSSTEQGEPPPKKAKVDSDNSLGQASASVTQQPATQSSSAQPSVTDTKPSSTEAKPSLTAMLGNYASDSDSDESNSDPDDQDAADKG